MKKNKIFLIPLSALAITASSVVPVLASCSSKEEKEISEDYSLSIEKESVETDIWYNENWDKYITRNKQYVTFELKLNQPIYMETKDEVVSQMVGLPWVDSKLTKVNYKSDEIANLIDIDKTEVMAYPKSDNQTIILFVPYSISLEGSGEAFEEGELFTLDVTIKFYKGSAEQFENDQMTQISEPYHNDKLVVSHKKLQHVKMDSPIWSLNLNQSDTTIQRTYELHKDGYNTVDDSAMELMASLNHTGEFNTNYPKRQINGKQLNISFGISENFRRFQCNYRTGDISDDYPRDVGTITFSWEDTSFSNNRSWQEVQQIQFASYTTNPEGTYAKFDAAESEKQIQFTQIDGQAEEKKQLPFLLTNDLPSNQELHIFGMTAKGSYINWWDGQPISFNGDRDDMEMGYVIQDTDITNKQFNIPQTVRYDDENVHDITDLVVQYAIECIDKNTGQIVWTQTINGFKTSVDVLE